MSHGRPASRSPPEPAGGAGKPGTTTSTSSHPPQIEPKKEPLVRHDAPSHIALPPRPSPLEVASAGSTNPSPSFRLPMPSPSGRSSNPLDVHTMLNPQPEPHMIEEARGLRRKASHIESPTGMPSSPRHPISHSGHRSSISESAEAASPRKRRNITPRSPRSVSLGSASFHKVDAKSRPFLRDAISPSLHHIPPVPPLPQMSPIMPAPQLSKGGQSMKSPVGGPPFSFPTQPAPVPGRRTQLLNPGPGSRSTSPGSSYSYSQTASPSPQFGSLAPQAHMHQSHVQGNQGSLSQYIGQGPGPGQHPAQSPGFASYEARSGQSSSKGALNPDPYLLMDIGDGNVNRIEVDVQKASISADIKRARNADASLRFRQRRKEREKAQLEHITRLERENQQLREVGLFYRNERNSLRDYMYGKNVAIPLRPGSPQSANELLSPSIFYSQVPPLPSYERSRSATMPASMSAPPSHTETSGPQVSRATVRSRRPPQAPMNPEHFFPPPPPPTSAPPPAMNEPSAQAQRSSSPYDPYEPGRYDTIRRK